MWQCQALAIGFTAALVLVIFAIVEVWKGSASRVTYAFLQSHTSVSSVHGAISDHWGQLATVATLFLAHTVIRSQSTTNNKYSTDYPWTVAFYISLTITGASFYGTAVFSCIVHRTATAGLKEIAMTKYVLSMPRCIGGPLLLNLSAWVVTGIASAISFGLEQGPAVAVLAITSQAACWAVISFTAYSAFSGHKEEMDLEVIEKNWLMLHDVQSEPDDDEEEDVLHGVQDQDKWCLVTHTLAKEIKETEEKSKETTEFRAAVKSFADAQHRHCLGKLKNVPENAPQDLIATFQSLHLAKQLAE